MILHQKSSPIPPDGIVLHNSFQVSQHRSSRLESALILLGQALIILTGLIGAGYTFLTSFSITHYPLILLPFLLFCTLYWTFLLTRKSPFWTLLGRYQDAQLPAGVPFDTSFSVRTFLFVYPFLPAHPDAHLLLDGSLFHVSCENTKEKNRKNRKFYLPSP